jgi:hypothetical protein
MRAWYFARELAARGHEVVQICERRQGTDPLMEIAEIETALHEHDWSEPLLIAVAPRPSRTLDMVRASATPEFIRKSLVLWNYWRHSGMFNDFTAGAERVLPVIAAAFQPEVVWGLFGNTDCWRIAQQLGEISGCRWVADMKDSWEVFLPRLLQRPLAARFQDMSGCTANAEFNAQVMRRWFPQTPTVVYSGVDESFYLPLTALEGERVFRITLTGSVYVGKNLGEFVSGLREWLILMKAEDRLGVEFVYAGGDSDKVGDALRPVTSLVRTVVHAYLPLPKLASLCRSASVNCYIRSPNTFHHKLLELLACGRPALAFGGETDESRRLAKACGGDLLICDDDRGLVDELAFVWSQQRPPAASVEVPAFTWGAQSVRLARVFEDVVGMAA